MKLLALAAAFVGGVALGISGAVALPLAATALFGIAALAAALLLRSLRLPPLLPLIPLAALALTLGVIRASPPFAADPPPVPNGAFITAGGEAISDIDSRGSFGRFRFRVDSASYGNASSGASDGSASPDGVASAASPALPPQTELLVWAHAPAELTAQRHPPYIRYGDRLRIQGRVSQPPTLDGFDYAAHLERQGVSGIMYADHAERIERQSVSEMLHSDAAAR